jgi:hypothetical protein
MLCNDLRKFKESRRICRSINLEDELNHVKLLRKIYSDTFSLIGITPQPIAVELMVEKEGEVILRYATEKKIDAQKILALVAHHDKSEACRILGRTATCLMEDYGIFSGGLKIP